MTFVMFLLGLVPILWMILALIGFKWAGYKASIVAMLLRSFLSPSGSCRSSIPRRLRWKASLWRHGRSSWSSSPPSLHTT